MYNCYSTVYNANAIKYTDLKYGRNFRKTLCERNVYW